MGIKKHKGHEYELVLIKQNHKEFKLKLYTLQDDLFMIMQFESDDLLQKNDLIWAQVDMDVGNTDLMLLVVKTYSDPNKVLVKTPGNIFTKDLRQFNKEEVFKIVATYRKK